MTTVINLNILNFFRLKLNKYTVNDVRFNTHNDIRLNPRHSDGNKNHSPEEEHVVDVTPYSKVVADTGTGNNNRGELTIPNLSQAEPVIQPAVIDRTYDRRGNTVQYFQANGVHVDSYV
ncbi:MAG TPA: hypothetical protein ENG83_15725 [Nitrospirae bacterium]|nr:hypothetical protein BMS3Abin06_02056 [bacterium BMS3Abin06]HDH13618.1 hypothetical protein [Nitrospirota bacterium]HDZ00926.1 hypothetical protein [Nitrospirota bacterium]